MLFRAAKKSTKDERVNEGLLYLDFYIERYKGKERQVKRERIDEKVLIFT